MKQQLVLLAIKLSHRRLNYGSTAICFPCKTITRSCILTSTRHLVYPVCLKRRTYMVLIKITIQSGNNHIMIRLQLREYGRNTTLSPRSQQLSRPTKRTDNSDKICINHLNEHKNIWQRSLQSCLIHIWPQSKAQTIFHGVQTKVIPS